VVRGAKRKGRKLQIKTPLPFVKKSQTLKVDAQELTIKFLGLNSKLLKNEARALKVL
jgi:hypothetical protein